MEIFSLHFKKFNTFLENFLALFDRILEQFSKILIFVQQITLLRISIIFLILAKIMDFFMLGL